MPDLTESKKKRKTLYDRIAALYKKEKNYTEVINLSEELQILDNKIKEQDNNHDAFNPYYTWAIYYEKIKTFDDTNNDINKENEFINSVETIINNSKQQDLSFEDKPCVYTISIMKALKYFYNKDKKNRTNENSKIILKYCDKLKRDYLKTISFRTEEGKEIASDFETYCLIYSKTLLNDKQYNKCIDFINNILNNNSTNLKKYQIWIKRIKAQSLSKLKQYDEALSILKEILITKRDWFIEKEIAEIYMEKSNINEAMVYSIKSIKEPVDILKLSAYDLLADLLKKQNRLEDAKKFIELEIALKKEKDYPVNENLLKENGLNLTNIRNVKEIKLEIDKILKKLEEQFIPKAPELQGTITKLIEKEGYDKNGFGFIDDQYYFRTKDFKDNKNLLSKGKKVSFSLTDSFDKKKNKTSKKAVNIKLV